MTTSSNSTTTEPVGAPDLNMNIVIPAVASVISTLVILVIVSVIIALIKHTRRRRRESEDGILEIGPDSHRTTMQTAQNSEPELHVDPKDDKVRRKAHSFSCTSLQDLTPVYTHKKSLSMSSLNSKRIHLNVEAHACKKIANFKHKPEQIAMNKNQFSAPSSPTHNKLHFFYHKILECDDGGLEHTIDGHNITIRIPQGAIAEGERLHIEVGVTLFGPFTFPGNCSPISPILQLCPTETDYKFQKPISVILPHFLSEETIQKLNPGEISFAKAMHHSIGPEKRRQNFKFEHTDTVPKFASSGSRNFGVLQIQHCCYLCIVKGKDVEGAEYCLVQIERPLQQGSEFHFLVTYFLETCLQAVDEQYPSEEDNYKYQYKTFQFESRFLEMKIITEHSDYIIALNPNPPKIWQFEVSFRTSGTNLELMLEKHRRKLYPPRIKLTVTSKSPDNMTVIKLPVQFQGCSIDQYLDRDLTIPSAMKDTSSLPNPKTGTESHEVVTNETPSLKDAFKELLPLASKWKCIGTLLDVKDHIIDGIESNKEDVMDKLRAMLSKRMKETKPLTWDDIVDAIKPIDQRKSEDLRKRIPK